MPTPTFDVLGSATLTSSGSIDIQNIPTTYTDLFISGQLRAAGGSTVENCWYTFNSNTSAVYNDMRGVLYSGSTFANNSSSGLTEAYIGAISGNTATAGIYSHFTLNLNNYASTGMYRPYLGHWAARAYEAGIRNGNFVEMSNPITRITFNCGGGSGFAAGSQVTVWGIRAA